MTCEELIKPPREYIIHSPRLRKIRRELRTLIKLAVLDEYERLDKLEMLYRNKEYKEYLNVAQKKRIHYLIYMRQKIKHTFLNSICACARGNSLTHADISGDRVRYHLIRKSKHWDDNPCIIEKQFYSKDTFEKEGSNYMEYYRHMRWVCKHHPPGCISYEEDRRKYEKKFRRGYHEEWKEFVEEGKSQFYKKNKKRKKIK